jgi:hypothetical protein
MSEIMVKYDTQLRGRDDRRYEVQATGRERPDGLWEGWLEFLPLDGGPPVVSERETTQPNRKDLAYWATGLTDPYLDGALLRALTEVAETLAPSPALPVSDAPTPHVIAGDLAAQPLAVLDPFHVYAEGDAILRRQLHALSETQLRNIVRAYDLSTMSLGELERVPKLELVTLIMAAAEERAPR